MIHIGGPAEHDFGSPLGLLSDCHRRIEMFHGRLMLALDRFQGQALTDAAANAVRGSLRYFQEAAPLHTADEEESLFPLLRAGADPAMRELVARLDALHADHRRMDAGQDTIRALFERWLAQGTLVEGDAAYLRDTLSELQTLYGAHLAFEDEVLFPAAARWLTADQISGLGRAMAHRRGVVWP